MSVRKVFTGVEGLLDDPIFSDVTVLVGQEETEHKAHRAIICQYSEFFKAACTGNFTESSSRVIRLPEVDDILLSHTLRFLYSSEGKILGIKDCTMQDLADLFSLADMLGIESMKRYLFEQLGGRLSFHIRKEEDVVQEIECINQFYLHNSGFGKVLRNLVRQWVAAVAVLNPSLVTIIVSFVREDLQLESGFMVDVLHATGGLISYDD